MRRTLINLGLIAFIVLDVVLIAFAVQAVRDNDPSAGADAGAGPVQTPKPTGSEFASKRRDRLPPAPRSAQTVLLDVGTDGTVLRAIRGSCGGDEPVLELSTDGGESFSEVDAPASMLMRLDVSTFDDIWMVGLDEGCDPTFYRSADGGESWDASAGSQGAWHLLSRPGQALHAPDGQVALRCQPVSVAPLGFDVAYAGCRDGRILSSRNRGISWIPVGRLNGVSGLAYRAPRLGFAISLDEACPAAVWRTTNGGADWEELTCLDTKAPATAIAVSEGVLLVQVGTTLYRSTGVNETWEALG